MSNIIGLMRVTIYLVAILAFYRVVNAKVCTWKYNSVFNKQHLNCTGVKDDCCGKRYIQYCCKKSEERAKSLFVSWTSITVIVVILAFILCCKYACHALCKRRLYDGSDDTVALSSLPSGSYPVQSAMVNVFSEDNHPYIPYPNEYQPPGQAGPPPIYNNGGYAAYNPRY